MSLRFRNNLACLTALTALIAGCNQGAGTTASSSSAAKLSAAPTTRRVLHISADPNNLPFTNDRLEGFENKIAQVIAKDLNADVQYHWRAQRRGFFREALTQGEADLVLGVPAGFERALTTTPYYRSTYVFVWRQDRNLTVESFNDPVLKQLKIGVQMVGDDYTNTPPAHALAARGIIDNVRGYTLYGDYARPNPPARIIDALATGEIDIAVVWGPLAAYFAGKQSAPMELRPVLPAIDPTGLPFSFNIAMGVRKGNTALRDELNVVLARHQTEIDRILDDYRVPRVTPTTRPAEHSED
jgi:mxaJ protein